MPKDFLNRNALLGFSCCGSPNLHIFDVDFVWSFVTFSLWCVWFGPRLVSEVRSPENSKQIHEWITNLCRCMNLHINVIRGGCVHGYFQQRGWEDVKHAKPLCIYANWAPFSYLNMNLAQMKLFTGSLVFCFVSLFCFFFSHRHIKCAAACLHIIARLHPGKREICGFPVILLFVPVFMWHSKYCSYVWQRCWEASGAHDFCMQISDSEAYAKEVTESKIRRGLHARYKSRL